MTGPSAAIRWASVGPTTSSVASQGRSASASAPSTACTRGCCTRWAAPTSLAKRARAVASCSEPSGSTFTATSVPSVAVAAHTSPMPPVPTGRTRVNPPRVDPGTST